MNLESLINDVQIAQWDKREQLIPIIESAYESVYGNRYPERARIMVEATDAFEFYVFRDNKAINVYNTDKYDDRYMLVFQYVAPEVRRKGCRHILRAAVDEKKEARTRDDPRAKQFYEDGDWEFIERIEGAVLDEDDDVLVYRTDDSDGYTPDPDLIDPALLDAD